MMISNQDSKEDVGYTRLEEKFPEFKRDRPAMPLVTNVDSDVAQKGKQRVSALQLVNMNRKDRRRVGKQLGMKIPGVK